MTAASDSGPLRRWLNLIVFAVSVGSVVSCNALNQSGFCIERMSWVSDNEKIEFAILQEKDSHPNYKILFDKMKSFLKDNPNCCRVYKKSELIGQDDIVELGLVARPSYIRVEGGNPENIVVSSCADDWWPWRSIPLPPGADIP